MQGVEGAVTDKQVEIRVTFDDPRMAGRFASRCHESGYVGERVGGNVVTVIVHSQRDGEIVLGHADEFGGHAEVPGLSDDE